MWNRDQVRGLMQSLYREHPVGGLLPWETETNDVSVRGVTTERGGTHLLLLDGQQRITSLYGVIRGKAPAFFDGDEAAFTGLYFNVAEERFEFYAPRFEDSAHRDKVLYWYIHAALWGRFAGSTETFLQKDYETAERSGVDGLIAALERWRGGNLDIHAHDFEGSTKGSRFYPLLYMLTRVEGARDFGSGLELRAEMLGRLSSLQVHHVFPKALLYQAGYERTEVNAIANFCFLTQDTNLVVGSRSPAEYFAEVEEKHPGVLASQWIPSDPKLWQVERYRDFLEARRELLAGAAQSFLTGLRTGVTERASSALQPLSMAAAAHDDARAAQVNDLIAELVRLGCARPNTDTEIADPHTGRRLAVAEAFWPTGLQPGKGDPVVLELDPEEVDRPRLDELGYEVFTSADALRGYVRCRSEAASGDSAGNNVENDDTPDRCEPDQLAVEFDRRMRRLDERSRHEANYGASHFHTMLNEYGGVVTARKVVANSAPSEGFASLWERGRLDLTVEALVTDREFTELFTSDEVNTARQRLRQFGYAE